MSVDNEDASKGRMTFLSADGFFFCVYLNWEQGHVISVKKHALQIDSQRKHGFWTEFLILDTNLTAVSFHTFYYKRIKKNKNTLF